MVISSQRSEVEFQEFFSDIFADGLMVTGVAIKYNNYYRTIRSKGTGTTSVFLPSGFAELLNQQLTTVFDELVLPLIRMLNFNFEIKLEVEKSGFIRMDKVNLVFKVDCTKNQRKGMIETPIRVILPFMECTDFIRVRGRDYKATVIESIVNGSLEELKELIHTPIVGDAAKKQWHHFIQIVTQEVKTDFSYELSVPVLDAEIVFEEGNVRSVQHVIHLDERFRPIK